MKNKLFKIILFCLTIFFNSNCGYSQSKNNMKNLSEESGDCVRIKNISFKNRLKIFPFENTSQIIIVSYKTRKGLVGEDLQKHLNTLKINDYTFNEKEFDEVKKLNLVQTEKLTDIIFNYSHKKKEYSFDVSKCYQPRNAILFTNNDDKIIAWIEICFDCGDLRTSDERIAIGDYCNQKYDLIKTIFRDSGIKYGITEIE